MDAISIVNNNRVLWGVTMILLNFGSRYVVADLGKSHELLLSNEIAKKIIIFSMFFVGTRDILTSFLLTVAYIIIVDGILHENRKFNLLPKAFLSKAKQNVSVSQADYERAKQMVSAYEKQTSVQTNVKDAKSLTYINYLNNVSLIK
jgi:phosphomannomutase